MEPLSRHLKKAKLFVDTSSLMHPNSQAVFLGEVKNALIASNGQLFVAVKVYEEIKKHQANEGRSRDDEARRRRATDGFRILRHLDSLGLIQYIGDKNDQFPDAFFHTAFSRYRTENHLSLITQDVSLMVDILRLQTSCSVKWIKPITIFEVTANGLWWQTIQAAEERLARQRVNNANAKGRANDELLKANLEIKVGTVFNTTKYGSNLVLAQEIKAGGEGTVFFTSRQGIVAKIYHQDKLTVSRREKLKLMLAKSLNPGAETRGICWPLETLTDREGIFRGYLMPEARGVEMGGGVFVRPEIEKNFPHWNRLHLVTLCLSLLEKIQHLHDSGILIGDINEWNILVENENSVFLVDLDSCQIGNFPSPVGTVYFTPPELQEGSFTKKLRTDENEYFAIATMLFMILHAGKQPYAQLGGGTPGENIKAMQFPYPWGENTNKKAPEGPWKYIWSHLSYLIKGAFYQTFHASYKGMPRRTPAEWIWLLERYKYELKQGYHSKELFPNFYEQVSRYAVEHFDNETEIHTCSNCGDKFPITPKEKEFFVQKRWSMPKRCPGCRGV